MAAHPQMHQADDATARTTLDIISGPYHNAGALSVKTMVYRRDTVVKRKLNVARRKSRPTNHSGRRAVQCLSFDSARRLRFAIRNSQAKLGTELVLTYQRARAPCTGAVAKKHLNAFLQWLRRRNCSGVWVLEFQRNGSAHFHILTDAILSAQEVLDAWCRNSDQPAFAAAAKLTVILSRDACAGYLGDPNKSAVPKGFRPGKFWGTFGATGRPVAVLTREGPQAIEANRVLRRLSKARGRTKVDNGRHSINYGGIGEESLAFIAVARAKGTQPYTIKKTVA